MENALSTRIKVLNTFFIFEHCSQGWAKYIVFQTSSSKVNYNQQIMYYTHGYIILDQTFTALF